jgi:hypothetical protein
LRSPTDYTLNAGGQAHSVLIGTETLSLVIYRGEPDQNISFEVIDAGPASEVL